jgi:hypothetical protein
MADTSAFESGDVGVFTSGQFFAVIPAEGIAIIPRLKEGAEAQVRGDGLFDGG